MDAKQIGTSSADDERLLRRERRAELAALAVQSQAEMHGDVPDGGMDGDVSAGARKRGRSGSTENVSHDGGDSRRISPTAPTSGAEATEAEHDGSMGGHATPHATPGDEVAASGQGLATGTPHSDEISSHEDSKSARAGLSVGEDPAQQGGQAVTKGEKGGVTAPQGAEDASPAPPASVTSQVTVQAVASGAQSRWYAGSRPGAACVVRRA
jgi:hypothetical protein